MTVRGYGHGAVRVILVAAVIVIGGALLTLWQHYEGARCDVARVRDDWETSPDLEECAAAKVPRAQAYLGMRYWSASDSAHAGHESWGFERKMTTQELQADGRRLLEAAARQGDPIAQNEVGLAYFEGSYGMPEDLNQALAWLQLADERGDPIAPYNLARMYYSGKGAPRSMPQAEALLWRSAGRGYKPALCTLALLQESNGSEIEGDALRQAAARLDSGFACAFDHSDVTPEFRAGFARSRH